MLLQLCRCWRVWLTGGKCHIVGTCFCLKKKHEKIDVCMVNARAKNQRVETRRGGFQAHGGFSGESERLNG